METEAGPHDIICVMKYLNFCYLITGLDSKKNQSIYRVLKYGNFLIFTLMLIKDLDSWMM